MKVNLKKLLCLCLLGLKSCYSFAFEDFETKSPLLANDHKILSKLNQKESSALEGNVYKVGEVQFTYGASIPTIICAVLEITDISLEVGERILSVQIGDGARWAIESAVSGSMEESVEHLILKPLDQNLKTSLLIATDRRTYHLRLKSTQNDFMPLVSFYYPNQNVRRNQGLSPRNAPSAHQGVLQYTSYSKNDSTSLASSEESSERRYIFSITGDDRLLPQNAYTDGKNTYIQMDHKSLKPLPNLTAVSSTSLFSQDKLMQVNYRLEGTTYVVEGVFDHLRLQLSLNDKEYLSDIVKEG